MIDLGLVDDYGNILSVTQDLDVDKIRDYTVREIYIERISCQLGVGIVFSLQSLFLSGLQ